MFPVTNFLIIYRQNKQNIPYLRVAILFENKQNYLYDSSSFAVCGQRFYNRIRSISQEGILMEISRVNFGQLSKTNVS